MPDCCTYKIPPIKRYRNQREKYFTMQIDKSSSGCNPNCGDFKRIVTQSFLLLLLRICAAYGENTSIESCQTEIYWKPIHYYIKISTDIHKNVTSFRGQVGIDGVALQDTNELLLHSKLNLTEAFYTIEDQRYEINLQLTQETNGTLILKLKNTLIKDQQFHLIIKYNGNMNTNPGIYVSYYNSTNGPRPVVSTELQPMGARHVFPCLDEPRFKAKFSIEVARPQTMVTLSNMELITTSLPDPKEDNQVWDTFHPTPIMSTYLVCIVICADYENISLPRNSFFWFPRESKDAVQFLATERSNLFLNSMETFTGINYTLHKLDQVLIPENMPIATKIGMENWGLITWGYRYIESASQRDSLIMESGWNSIVALAHEIVHQWMGNLVTCRYWCYLWLNEGLTTFMSYHIVNQVFPLTKSIDMFIIGTVNSIMKVEITEPTHLVSEEECCMDEMFEFTPESASRFYLKGAAIMIMVESNILDHGTFQNGIQRYLNNNRYGTVTNKELWGSFQEVIEDTSITAIPEGSTLETVMDTWTRNAGFPIVHMHRFENGSVAVRQEEFLIKELNQSNVFWWIPLTYTTTSKKDFSSLRVQEWLSPSPGLKILETQVSENEWIILNLQQKGYYKVNYDLKTWEIITDHLINGNINDIHPMNRASLINDAFMLAESGFINFSVALNLSKYLVRENNYFPLKAVEDGMFFLQLSLRGTSVYDKFTEYFRFVFSGIYQKIRLGRINVTDLPSSWLKEIAIRASCGCGSVHCRQQALKAAESIINQEIQEEQICPLARYEMWCYAVKLGGERIFDYVKNKYINENDKVVKRTLLDYLFCADNKRIPSLVKEALIPIDYFKTESPTILLDIIFENPNAICESVNFITDHYDTVIPSISDILLEKALNETLDLTPLNEECRGKAIELITKFYNATYIYQNATLLAERNMANINSWLDEQNLPKEVYSDDNDTFVTKPNMFLRQDEFNFFKLK